jgi:ATP-dependent helicase HrpB
MDQLKKLVSGNTKTISNKEEALEQLLIEVYADRLCRRRKVQSSEAKMVGGRGVKIHADSSVKQAEYFLAIELSEGRDSAHATVFQAVGLQTNTIEEKIAPLAKMQSRLEWDSEKKKFWSIESKEWNKISIGSETRRPAKSEEIQNQLVDVAAELFEDLLLKNESLGHWYTRLKFLNLQKSEHKLLSEEQTKEALTQACYGENSLEALEKKDMVSFFEGQLEEKTKTALYKECPSHLTVPTGNRYRIQYTEEQGPLLEVRLQELFGLTQTPMIAGVPVTLFLLAPNFRPVQVTRDIISFWKNGYPEVRKEMRSRYPKHSWPDDPLTAPPQAKGRHHGK